MLRRLLIYLSKAKWAQQLISRWGFARRAALRFVAGEQLSDAVRAVNELNKEGIQASLDFLGENNKTEAETREATSRLVEVLDAIHQNQLKANLSVKLSQIGLLLDQELCEQNLLRILDRASENGIFVRIDMEDSSLTEKTITLFEHALQKGYSNVGIVLQAYLYRTHDDLERLARFNARIRLVKGAYKEPAELAYPSMAEVNASFDKLAERLLQLSKAAGFPSESADQITPPMVAIGTHAARHIESVIGMMGKMQVPPNAVEFQLLYGIRRDLQQSLSKQGYPVRVYTPFGTHWYPYFMRRLAERPANLKFFLSNYLKG
jgi:proline dehydrogenase